MNDFVTGDTGSALIVTCTDNASSLPINLTGATVSLKWKTAANALVTKAMTIISPTAGTAKYQFLATDLFSPSMSFEVEITDAGGKIISNLDLIDVSVREQLA